MTIENITQQLKACESLITEHRQAEMVLDALERYIRNILEAEPIEIAMRHKIEHLFNALFAELNTHFACEEEGLFPILSKYHPMVLMEIEHEELMELKQNMVQAFSQSETDSEQNKAFKNLGLTFIEELRRHIVREDSGIFPMAERDLSVAEKTLVVQKMNEVRQESTIAPTPPIQRPERKAYVVDMDMETPVTRNLNVQKLFDHDGFHVKQMTIQGGQSLPAYWSPYSIFLLCVSGEAQWEGQGQTIDLAPGKGLYMDPQMRHAIYAKTDCRLLMYIHV